MKGGFRWRTVSVCALDRSSENRQSAQAWGLSLILHGFAVSLAVLFVANLRLDPQPEPFKWDVSLIEAQAQKAPDNPSPDETASSTPVAPPVASRQVRPKPVETKRRIEVVQTLQPIQRPVQQIVRHEGRETQSLVEPAVQATLEPTAPALETTSRTAVPIETPLHSIPVQSALPRVREIHLVEKKSPMPASHEVAIAAKPVATEVTPISSPESAVLSRPVVNAIEAPASVQERVIVKEAETMMVEPTIIEHDRSTKPILTEPVTLRELPIRSSPPIQEAERSTPLPIEQTRVPEPPPIDRSSISELPLRSGTRAKADFGWLTQALLSRVEQLKRYPHVARMNHWEGRVVVRAVIREDGDVIGVEIIETSGHSELDYDALDIVRKASPLTLEHPLGQPQVVVRLPIRYRLEH